MVLNRSEIWKPIPDHTGYEASNLGFVRSIDRVVMQRDARGNPYDRRFRGKLLKKMLNAKHRYWIVKITDDNNRHYELRVAHAVLLAFVGPRPPGTEACHNDGNSENNAIGNLRWDTRANNAADSVRHGTSARGEKHPMHKLSRADILKIRDSAESNADLARIYGVGPRHIYKIRSGRTWGWLDADR